MNDGIRVNKYLSEAGYCSRREADRLVEQGKVQIDGTTAAMGSRIGEGQKVTVDGKEIRSQEPAILLLLNKPKGIVCTAEKKEKNNIVDYLGYPSRVYPVGRLDKDSRGLILLTNQGDIVNKMMRSGNAHEKEYEVTVDKPVTDSFLQGMAGGVPLRELQVMTRKCQVWRTGKFTFNIVLTQGYNRQIRRMCEYFGYHVVDLLRTRIMNLSLGDLKEGEYRLISKKEEKQLRQMLEDSSNLTVTKPREINIQKKEQKPDRREHGRKDNRTKDRRAGRTFK